MSNWNLPPGCTDRMVDEAFGYKDRHGTYTVVVTRTVEQSVTIEVEASSEDEAREDALNQTYGVLNWKEMDAYDVEVESVVEPKDEEQDPDDARDARIDYLMDRDR